MSPKTRDQAQFSGSYAEIYDLLHTGKPYDREVGLVLDLATRALGHKPRTVIDLACGTGRHLVELARQGVKVHGNDLSGGMVACARQRLERAGVSDFTLTEAPMQAVAPGPAAAGGYELATAYYTALGYLVAPRELDRFFRNLRRLLVQDGVFFADFWGGPRMARDFSPSRTKEVKDGGRTVRRISHVTHVPAANALQVRFDFEVTGGAGAGAFSESHLVRYHSLPEIETILLAHGFELIEAAPFFDEATRVEEAWNFHICARKR